MKSLKNIEDYFSFIEARKEWFIEKYRKNEFISASKLFIINGSKNVLEEILSQHKSNNKIKIENFIKISGIIKVIKKIETLKDDLANETNSVKNKVEIILKNLDKTNEEMLNSIQHSILNKIENKEFDTNRIMNKDDKDYFYIFSRLTKEQKDQLKSVIEKFYKKVDSIITNFKNDTK